MPPSLEEVQAVDAVGVAPTYIAADVDGHLIPANKGRTIVNVKNDAASSITLTIKGGLIEGAGRYLADRTISVAAGTEKSIRLTQFDVRAEGQAEITFSSITDVSFALLL